MIELQIASKKDIPVIQSIAGKTWNVTYGSILSEHQLDYMFEMMYSNESLTQQLDEGQTFYIAYDNGEPCGYVSVEKQSEEIFHLQKLYVEPRKQGTGLGKILITKIFEHAKLHSATPEHCFVELNVNRNNKALQFYQHMGMSIDRTVDIPIGEGFFMNDYIMKKQV